MKYINKIRLNKQGKEEEGKKETNKGKGEEENR